ncbi:MAG TPA: DUF5118 domain-containing protein, partial [Terriglobia bacterium]|nr:DUF5118 domain-containing protein [Terriglobia bacterium]
MKGREAVLFAVLLACTVTLRAQVPASPEPKGETKKEEGPKKEEAPKPKPFAEVIKDAQVVQGLFTLYRTEDKVLLEVLPSQFDNVYVLSLTCESGLGERGFYASMMCGETPFMFHRQG